MFPKILVPTSTRWRVVLFALLTFVLASWVLTDRRFKADRIFDVQAYGAKGDCTASGSLGSCTNDVAAIRKAIAAANANGGGVVYVPNTPTNAYYQLVGDPSTDVNYTTITAPHYALWNITSNNVRVVLAPGVTIRTVASYLCQTNSGGGTLPCSQYLFYYGNGVTVIEDGINEGNWGTFKFEVASPAALTTHDNGANGFHFWGGKTKQQKNRQFYINGFPNGGTIDGYTSGSDTLTDAVFEDVRTLEYGGGADDLLWYVQGNVTFERCWFKTSRKSSHGVYTGAVKPFLRINNCYFEGQDASAGLNNKYGIQLYQTSGTASINSIWITNNTFKNVRNGIWGEHVNGGSGGSLDNIQITGNTFTRDSSTPVGTAIQLQWVNDSTISNNYGKYQTGLLSVLSSGPGKNLTIENNRCFDCTGLLNAATAHSTISGNKYRRSGVASTGATRFNVQGNYNTIDKNIIVDGGSSSGSPVGMIVNGTGNVASLNQIYATASQSYSIMFQAANCHQCNLSLNQWNNNGSAYNDISGDGMTLLGNQTNKLTVVNGSGSVYTRVIGHKAYSSAQLRLTGLAISQNSDITGGWETVTGAYGGSGNLTSSADLDTAVATTSGTYTPHVGTTSNFLLTANGNLTLGQPTNPLRGKVINFVILQDATGGRTITFSSTYYVSSCSVTTTANTRTSVSFVYDSALTKFVQVGSCATGM